MLIKTQSITARTQVGRVIPRRRSEQPAIIWAEKNDIWNFWLCKFFRLNRRWLTQNSDFSVRNTYYVRTLNSVFTSILELFPSKVWSDVFTPKNHPGILKRVFALFLPDWSDFTPNESERAFRSGWSDDFTPKVFSVLLWHHVQRRGPRAIRNTRCSLTNHFFKHRFGYLKTVRSLAARAAKYRWSGLGTDVMHCVVLNFRRNSSGLNEIRKSLP